MTTEKCPIYQKYALTIKEAAEYFNLGEKKLRYIVQMYNTQQKPFALRVGNKTLIKRELFSEFLDNIYGI
jgi:excisionase family DNA binding protein